MTCLRQTKWNTLAAGLAGGLIGPVIGFWLYYYSHHASGRIKQDPLDWLEFVMDTPRIQSPVLSLSLIFNLALFFFFIWKHCDRSARGVLMATFIYAPFVLILKLG